jgi:DNA-binding beta-propeller fold protein YncE
VVSAINLDSREVVANIPVAANAGLPGTAIALDISPDGHWAYVLSITPTAPGGLIIIIDMTVSRVVGIIPVGPKATRVVFSRDGQFAVVNNTGDGTISLIDVKTRKVSAVKVGGSVSSNPREVAFSQNTFPIWTANLGSRNASVINKDALVAANIDLGFNAMAVAVTRDGTRAFLMGPQEKLMAVVDTAGGQQIVKTIKMSGVASSVEAIATAPDDRGIIAIHTDINAMSVIETRALSVRAVINLPKGPFRCLVTNDGKLAVVLCKNQVSIVEMESVLPTVRKKITPSQDSAV